MTFLICRLHMDQKQNSLRTLLTEAIIKLCQMEAVYTDELKIEGTVCVISDRASVMIAHFAECVGDSQSIENDRNYNSEPVFGDGLSMDRSEQMLPEVKVENTVSDETVRSFEGVSDSESLSFMSGFCEAAEESLNASENNAVAKAKKSTGGQYQCAHCEKVFQFKRSLNSHMKIHAGHQSCIHICHHCSASFDSPATLHIHIKREHDGYQPSGKKQKAKSRRQQHTVRRRDVASSAEHINSVEDVSYLDTNIHMPNSGAILHSSLEADDTDSLALLEALEQNDYKMMIDSAPLLMNDINATDTNMAEGKKVQQLTRSHKAAPRTCSRNSTGGKATIMQFFEKVQVETPNGLYQYKCSICDKMFKLRTSLYEHINSHTGLRRYTCDQCGHKFVHHSSLHNHVQSKHMVAFQQQATLRYPCTGCDRRFKFCSLLARHLKSNPDHCTKDLDKQ